MGARVTPDWVYFVVANTALAVVSYVLGGMGIGRFLIEVSFADFFVITCLIGGGAAYMTGRAIASTWRPYWHVVAYMVPFAIFVRWVHFALFHGTLLSFHYTLVDFVICLGFATLGYRQVRVAQMTTQYRWLYERTGQFTWRRRTEVGG